MLLCRPGRHRCGGRVLGEVEPGRRGTTTGTEEAFNAGGGIRGDAEPTSVHRIEENALTETIGSQSNSLRCGSNGRGLLRPQIKDGPFDEVER